ncbi:MAG TPA: diphthamide biosynthesis enzyme Dph2 [Thermoplasmata archaeon]|nr:diphthamide biosynthesis enzyme Dph2 [Thermoplasmata archaeon]
MERPSDVGPSDRSVDALLDPEGPPVRRSPSAQVFATVDEPLFEALRRGRHTKLAVQVPAGLVRDAHELAARIREATGRPTVVVSRACFGACDFPTPDEVPGVDGLVVLGHAPIPNVRLALPTYFVEMRHPGGDPLAIARTIRASGLPDRLGLVASVQHLDLVAPLVRAFGSLGGSLVVGTGDRRLAEAAQALGCNYTSAGSIAETVEGFLFLGTGRFHPIGLALSVDRPVWAFDPLQHRLEPPIDRAGLVRSRQLLVAHAMDARRFGILVSSFPGQDRSGMAAGLAERARRRGRTAEILVASRLDPRDLEGRSLDAYVNTACPRIALDDASLYPKPMLTPPEFLMALGELPLEPYRFDTFH